MVMLGGYSVAQVNAAVRQMAGSYRVRTRVHLLDLEHKFIRDLSGLRVADGAVTVSADQPVSRSLSLQLVDRTDVLGLSGGLSAPTFLTQVWRGIYVDELSQWIDLPVICAYITKPSRSGDILTIEGQDKAALASFEASPTTIKKGTNVGSAIGQLLTTAAGEAWHFRLAKTSATLSRDYSLDSSTTPWALAQAMAASIGWKLFYDAEGYCVSRVASTSPSFEFRSGIGGTLTSPVQTGYWDGEIFNRVVVEGPVVSGKKVTAEAVLPASHPLSPSKLMRNNVAESGRRTFRHTSTTLKTRAAAEEWATRKLNQLAIQQQVATFSSVPIWHLQEFDATRAADPLSGVNVVSAWTQASIPLTCEGEQSNGFTKRRRSASRRVRTSSSYSAVAGTYGKTQVATFGGG